MVLKTDKRYTAWEMAGFFLSKIWENNRKLLIISLLQIPILVFSPYLNLLMQKLIIKGITEHYEILSFLLVIIIGYTVLIVVQALSEWLAGRSEWYNRVLVNTLLKFIDEKTLNSDYINIESAIGQEKRQKALNSVYNGGQRLFSVCVSLAVNFSGFLLYGITVCSYKEELFVIVVITALLGYFFTTGQHKYEQNQKDGIAKEDRKLKYLESESVSTRAGREIRLYQMQDMLLGIYHKAVMGRLNIEERIAKSRLFADMKIHFISLLRNSCAYVFLIIMVDKREIRVEDFVLLIGMVSGLSAWISNFMMNFADLRKMFLFFQDFFEYIEMSDEYDNLAEEQRMKSSFCVRFKDVCFSYNGLEEDTLHHINLTIHSGEKLALVGNNGAGKTTLVKLMTGLYRPTRGQILVNDIDISKYSKEEYYKCLSAVFQEILILPVSIAQNISSRTVEKTDIDKVLHCLKRVNLAERMEALPKSLDTLLNTQVRSEAIDLSGGEGQRLMIAKAFYKDSNFIVLDEPTAALDPIAESKIYEEYNRLADTKTSLFISHRLASTRFCDRIILLDGGRIVEEGNHSFLLEQKGLYYRMFTEQSKYYREDEISGL